MAIAARTPTTAPPRVSTSPRTTAPAPSTRRTSLTSGNAKPAVTLSGQNSLAPQKPARPLPHDPVSLASGSLDLSPDWQDAIAETKWHGLEVPVRLGKLAAGTVRLRKSGKQFETIGEPQALLLTHPALEPLRKIGIDPVLVVSIGRNQIKGHVTQTRQKGKKQTPDHPSALTDSIKKNAHEMGWFGMDLSHLPTAKNELTNGALHLRLEKFRFKLAGFLDGEGDFVLENELVTFHAVARTKIPGLAAVVLNLDRKPSGQVYGQVEVPLKLASFSGNLVARYMDGQVEITGTIPYKDEKFDGQVNFLVANAATARNVALEHLGPEAIQAAAEEEEPKKPVVARPTKEMAVAGWGALNFHFNDWLSGTAMVVIDDKGHLTVVGEIRPQAEIKLFGPKEFKKNIITIELKAEYGLPYVGGIGLEADFMLDFIATMGPGRLYDIVAKGRYSTDPRIAKEFSIGTALNISAYAALALTANGSVVLTILRHDIKVGAGVTATAGIRAYVEARPTIGYRETASPELGKKGEFYFSGHMEVAAQPFLGLEGHLFIELSTPWWSPVSDHTWTWPIGSLEYVLPGEFGIGLDVDHVIGSKKVPEVKFGEVAFSQDKFMADVLDDKVGNKTKGEQKKPAKWKEAAPSPTPSPAPIAPPKTPSKGPAPKQPATGKQSSDHKKTSSPAVARDWQRAIVEMRALAESSASHPLDPAEMKTAIARLKQRHKFTELRATRAGQLWLLHAEMNGKAVFKLKARDASAAAANKEETFGPPHNLDQPVTIDKESHVLRAHLEAGLLTILMASSKFAFIDERIQEIRHHYVDTYLPGIGKPEEAAKLATTLDRVIAIKNSIISRVNSAPTLAAKEAIAQAGIATVSRALQIVNSILARVVGEWARLRPGDIVVFVGTGSSTVPTADRFGKVEAVMVPSTTSPPASAKTGAGVAFLGVRATFGGRNPEVRVLPYANYGKTWRVRQVNLPGDPGSREAPFKIDWPKPSSSRYPRLYFGGVSSVAVSQASLTALFRRNEPDANGNVIREYAPHSRATTARGDTIGLTSRWFLDVGTKPVGPVKPVGTGTPGGYLLNDRLRPLGFDALVEGLDADHVHEIQVGGENTVDNLWPLWNVINGPAGGIIERSSVEYPDGSGRTIKLRELKADTRNLYFLEIKSVR